MADYKTISAPYAYSGPLNNFSRDVITKADMSNKRSYGAYPDLFTVICSDLIPDPKDPSKTIPGPDHGKVFVIDKTRDLDPEYGYCVPIGGGELPDNVTETFEEMPDPEEREEDEIVQYVGPTTDDFDNGNFYKDTRVEGEIPQLYPLSGNYSYTFGGEDKELQVISTSKTPEIGDTIYSLTFDANRKANLTEVGKIKSTTPAIKLEGLGGAPDSEAEAISNLINSFDASTPEKTPEISATPREYDPGDVKTMTCAEMMAYGLGFYYKVEGLTDVISTSATVQPMQYEWPAGSGIKKDLDLVIPVPFTKYGFNLAAGFIVGTKLVTITYDSDHNPIFTELAEVINATADQTIYPDGSSREYGGIKYTGPEVEAGTEGEAIKNLINSIDGSALMFRSFISPDFLYTEWEDPSKAKSYVCPSDDIPAFEIGDGSPFEFTYNSEEYSVKILALGTCQPYFGGVTNLHGIALPAGMIVENKTTGIVSRYNFSMFVDPADTDFMSLDILHYIPADFDTEPAKCYLYCNDSSLPFKDELVAVWNARFPADPSDGKHYAEISPTRYVPTPAEVPYKFPDYHIWTHVSQGGAEPFNGDKFEINMNNFKGVTNFTEFDFLDFMTNATYKYNDTIEYVTYDESTSPLGTDVIALGSKDELPGKVTAEYFVATGYTNPILLGFRATNNTSVSSAKITKVTVSVNGADPVEVPIVTEPNDRIYVLKSVAVPSTGATTTANFVIYLDDGKTMSYDVKLTNKVSNAIWYGYIPVDPTGTIPLGNIPYETIETAYTDGKLKSRVVAIVDSTRVDDPVANDIDLKVTCSGADNGHIAFFIPCTASSTLKDLVNFPTIIDKNRLDNTDSFNTYAVKDASGNFRGQLAVSDETPTCTNFKYTVTVNRLVVV